MYKDWARRSAHKVNDENINNSDLDMLDGMSRASFCQSRVLQNVHCAS